MKVFVTGATGNVGLEVIKSVTALGLNVELKAGVRDLKRAKDILPSNSCELVQFDFDHPSNLTSVLRDCEVLFLLRPPQISDVSFTIKPIIESSKHLNLKHIIFLSVQGAEDNTFIPHHKIEMLIKASKISYTFLRPAYFMQNFTTTLQYEIRQNRRIFLPAGKAKFSLIDVRDIGLVTAHILKNLTDHTHKSYTLTTSQNLSFQDMADIISYETKKPIAYQSPNLLKFIWVKSKQKMPFSLILVMIMLHYLPRFKKEPKPSSWVEKLTGKKPIDFVEFVRTHRQELV
jgi:uncharacterized protein YbjT (DUF2867 family)